MAAQECGSFLVVGCRYLGLGLRSGYDADVTKISNIRGVSL